MEVGVVLGKEAGEAVVRGPCGEEGMEEGEELWMEREGELVRGGRGKAGLAKRGEWADGQEEARETWGRCRKRKGGRVV